MGNCPCEIKLTVQEPDAVKLSYVEAEIKPEQTKDVVPAETPQTVEPDPGFTLGAVNVAAIPPEYIKPAGKITFTENVNDADISQFALADVAVPPPSLQQKTVTPTESEQIVEADTQQGYDALSRVTVETIPSEYIVPSGTIELTQDDTTVNVAQYENAHVSVGSIPEKGVVFSDWDSDGFALMATVYSACPQYYLSANNNCVYKKLKHIVFNNVDILMTDSCSYLSSLESITINRTENGTTEFYSNSFRSAVSLTDVVCNCNISRIAWAFTGCSAVKRMIFNGSIITMPTYPAWNNPFNGGSPPVELYDFSHCTEVFPLSAVSYLPHADGCVIKIPYALSDEYLGAGNGWQSATNWSALPTDPNTSGYVVWEVVNNAQS